MTHLSPSPSVNTPALHQLSSKHLSTSLSFAAGLCGLVHPQSTHVVYSMLSMFRFLPQWKEWRYDDLVSQGMTTWSVCVPPKRFSSSPTGPIQSKGHIHLLLYYAPLYTTSDYQSWYGLFYYFNDAQLNSVVELVEIRIIFELLAQWCRAFVTSTINLHRRKHQLALESSTICHTWSAKSYFFCKRSISWLASFIWFSKGSLADQMASTKQMASLASFCSLIQMASTKSPSPVCLAATLAPLAHDVPEGYHWGGLGVHRGGRQWKNKTSGDKIWILYFVHLYTI